MADTIDSVKELMRAYQNWAAEAEKSGNSSQKASSLKWLNVLQTAVVEMEELRRKVAPLPTRLGDLSDIPASLRAELSGIEVDELEGQLVTVINAYGGTADLNQVLVGLYRKFKIEQTRRFVQQKLWRMTADGLVWSVPKRKGVYTTKQQSIVPIMKDALDKISNAKALATKMVADSTDDDDEVPF